MINLSTFSNRLRSHAIAASLGVALVSCGAPSAEGGAQLDDVQAIPLLSMSLGESGTLELYEPEAGLVMLSGELPRARAAAMLPDLSAKRRIVDIYRALSPAGEVPAIILAAQERQDAYRAEPVLQREERTQVIHDVEDALIPKHSQQDADAWLASWCDVSHLQNNHLASESDCMTHRTGGGTWTKYDHVEYFSAVAPYEGSLTYRMRYKTSGSWSTNGQWNVDAGTTRWAFVVGSRENVDVENYIASTTAGYDRAWVVGTTMYCGSWGTCF